MSGCLNVTAKGLHLFVETSKKIRGENLFYCDNIVEGPMKETANGCENVDSDINYCCRTTRFLKKISEN
jgi:F-box/leucine-rich repeat protein 5